jgi:hypothetical protein
VTGVQTCALPICDELAAKMTTISEPVRIKLGANTDMWYKGERARSF